MKLSAKQERFVEEYLVDLNATQAAIRAGYSQRTANEQGARLLANVSIAAAIAEAKQARSERTQVTADRVLLELARIGFSDVMQHYEVDEGGRLVLTADAPDGASAAVASIKRKTRTFTKDDETEVTHEIEYKVWDKNTALANIGKHLGMFIEQSRNYDFNPEDFSDEGLERVARGEDPVRVLATGGRSASG